MRKLCFLNRVLAASDFTLCGASFLISSAISVDWLLALSCWGCIFMQFFGANVWPALQPAFFLFFLQSSQSFLTRRSSSNYDNIKLKFKDMSNKDNQNEGGIPLNIARYKKTVYSIVCVQLAFVVFYIPFIISFIILITEDTGFIVYNYSVILFLLTNRLALFKYYICYLTVHSISVLRAK